MISRPLNSDDSMIVGPANKGVRLILVKTEVDNMMWEGRAGKSSLAFLSRYADIWKERISGLLHLIHHNMYNYNHSNPHILNSHGSISHALHFSSPTKVSGTIDGIIMLFFDPSRLPTYSSINIFRSMDRLPTLPS